MSYRKTPLWGRKAYKKARWKKAIERTYNRFMKSFDKDNTENYAVGYSDGQIKGRRMTNAESMGMLFDDPPDVPYDVLSKLR